VAGPTSASTSSRVGSAIARSVVGTVGSVRRGSVADLMLLVTVTLWALNFSVSKYILEHGFKPLTYSATRYGVAALIFLVIVLAWEGTLCVRRRDLGLVAGAVALLLANQLSFVFALDLSTASSSAIAFGLQRLSPSAASCSSRQARTADCPATCSATCWPSSEP
jgi:hypothetical protein